MERGAWPEEFVKAHWIWRGSKANGKHPVLRVGHDIVTVRRVMYCLYNPVPEPKDIVFLKPTCGNELCVNPTHTEARLYSGKAPTVQLLSEQGMTAENTPDGDLEGLVMEIQAVFAADPPATFEALMAHPMCAEMGEKAVRSALRIAEIHDFDPKTE